MELIASGSPAPSPAVARLRRLTARVDPPAVAAWTLAFALVAYLALRNGGYDTIVRGQVGVAVWWIVLLGALAGVLPARIGRMAWVAIALLTGFALWTGLAIGWSESAERSMIELGRVAMYLGVLVLAIALQGRTAARHTINGLACAIGFVTLLAVLSRMHPQWFPVNDHAEFLGAASARRLSYPLNYWNALAAFAAIGVPLLLAVAIGARTLLGQALAAAMLPLSALCLYLTISRGGILALGVGVVVFLAFVPRRLDALATLLVAGAGAAILVAGASQRDALQDGVVTSAALDEGVTLLWLAVLVCAGVALLQVALGLIARHVERPALLAPSRRVFARRAALVAVVVCAATVVAGVPGWTGDRWNEFTAPKAEIVPGSDDNVFSRLVVANGNDRYQIWQAALGANAHSPWKGIGPGTFEFWWARHGTSPGFVRDAHTLYLETLAESGVVGLVLLGGLLVFLLLAGFVRALRVATGGLRLWIAAAAGGLATFMAVAAFEWVWEMAAIACAVLLLGAVLVAGREDREDVLVPQAGERESGLRRTSTRGVLALVAVVALGAVGVPMAGSLATRESREAVAHGQLAAALAATDAAQRLQPYAATPHLQRALVLEQAGTLDEAASAARSATRDEPTNWRTWFVLARVEARGTDVDSALRAMREARRLNPRSAVFAR